MSTKNVSVGYSKKINDPAFSKYLESSSKWSMYFALGLALIVSIGFFYYGATSNEMDNPEALFIGLGIGSMFVLIAFFQNLKRKKSKTWDGIVIDKNLEKKKRKTTTDNETYRWEVYDLYTVTIKSDQGKKHYITSENDATLYNYYTIGDKVRKHAGLNTYEKYDKSKDTIMFCNACSSLNTIEDDYCFRCKCPLLK